jgi:NADH-quinone oxidoreductase subunit H
MDLKVPPSPRLRRQPVASDGAPIVSTGRRGSTTAVVDPPTAPATTKEDGDA